MSGSSPQMTWSAVANEVLSLLPRQSVRVPRDMVSHPSTIAAFRASRGLPVGQIRDWRYSFADGRGLHVQEFEGYFLVHWDTRDPGIDFIGHLANDTPRLFMLGLVAIGAAIGAAIGHMRPAGVRTGALTGLLTAAGAGVLMLGKGTP